MQTEWGPGLRGLGEFGVLPLREESEGLDENVPASEESPVLRCGRERDVAVADYFLDPSAECCVVVVHCVRLREKGEGRGDHRRREGVKSESLLSLPHLS